MNRDALQSALDRDGSASARAALVELQAGSDFELFESQTASAHELWAAWSHRHQVMLDTGVLPRPGLAEAVDKLHAAGTARVHLATITGSQRRFITFLTEDLTRVIACV
ncbi:hypothetical protein ACFV0D_27245 [Streptomyces sp. NPDC059556]|uniref:hypothetical protein n=1 Tax=Streptomyces sp. NPDC059556 TaxID=3346863 RepID=UPI0036886257